MEGKEVTTMETTFKVTRTGLYVDVWVTRDGRTKVYSTLARNEREADYLVDLWTKCQENA
jgi:hypothetical protein